MLTKAGILLVLASAAIIATGRIFGLYELFIVGFAGIALCIAAVVYVQVRRPRLAVGRAVTPSQLHAGSSARVDLQFVNRGARTTPLSVRDPVSGTRGADVDIAPLARGEATSVAYRLPTSRRGPVQVGPLEQTVTDPFGLARLRTTRSEKLDLTVLPFMHEIQPPARLGGDDPHANAHPWSTGRSGNDFHALRPYVVGDDLRRVHWPSSARLDELVVRQNELPHQGRVTVVLDVTKDSMTPDMFEAMISAAASIFDASYRADDLVRVVATDGYDSGNVGSGHEHLAVLHYLAVVQPSANGDFSAVVQSLLRTGGGGAIVSLVGRSGSSTASVLRSLQPRYSPGPMVVFGREVDPTALAAAISVPSRFVLPLSAPDEFLPSWHALASQEATVRR